MANAAYKGLKGLYRKGHHTALRGLNAMGFNVALTKDFYSAMPVLSELKASRDLWDRPSELVGVSYELESIKQRLAQLVSHYGAEYEALPSYEEKKAMKIGPGFTLVDLMVLYMTLRDIKPRKYVEIGSGFSTYYAWLAIEKNREEGVDCDFRVVDPFPRDPLKELPNVEVRGVRAETVELDYFTSLEAGDVLFIDTTHVLKIGGEVAFLYLEVVPRLAPGVTIHAHDIHFPYNAPHPAETYILDAKWPGYWTEAMLLQAFLAFNPEFEIVMSTPIIRHFDDEFLDRTLPDYQRLSIENYDTHHGSLWMQRVARGG
ncbi:MAG: class I SAM-dependent methyltransferase [Acidobacteriota bacterium]|nr:class I SAM-dependent methyltransferase [Acidobacteriota bacterium]